MQKHRKLKARVLSLALSVAMVTSMMPATVFAVEGDNVPLGASSVGEIISFDELDSLFIPNAGKGASPHIYGLTVELDTAEADLNLPTELTAMVARTTVVTEDEDVVDSGKVEESTEDEIIPDEDEVVDEDTDDTVSGNQPASPSDAEEKADEEINDEAPPLSPEPEQNKETTVTTTESETIAVEWNSNKTFTSEQKGGPFIYTAELPEGYILADGVKAPQIYVFVGNSLARTSGTTVEVGDFAALSSAFQVGTLADGQTIKVTADITLSSQVTMKLANSAVTLDLNGHTLTTQASCYVVVKNGTLTIKNGTITGPTRALDIWPDASASSKAIIESATIECTASNQGSVNLASADAALVLNSGAILKANALTSDTAGTIKAAKGGTITVNSGATVETTAADMYAIYGSDGTGSFAATVITIDPGATITGKVKPGPQITFDTQPTATTTLTYSAISGSLSVAGTASNGNSVSYQWYKNTTNSATGGEVISGATSASYTIPTDLDAGTYYYYCVLKATGCTEKTSNVATVTVGKANYTPAPTKEVGVKINQSSAPTGTLTASDFFSTALTGAKISAINGSASNVLTAAPTLSNGTLSWTAKDNLTVKDQIDTFTATIESTNYNDISATLNFKSMDKTPVTITATVANKTYDGNAVTQPTPTAVETAGGTTATIASYDYLWQESNDSGSSYTNISGNTAPKDVGMYRLVVSTPSSNATYTGSKNVDFTINKATVTIAVKDKTANVGDPKPPFSTLDYTVSGLANGETLKTAPTLSYAAEPDMSKTGTYTINAISAVVPDGGNYETTIIYTTGTLTVKKSGGGGGSTGDSGSSGGGSSNTTPSAPSTDAPKTGSTTVTAPVDSKGNATVAVTDKAVADAIKAAQDAAKKDNLIGKMISVEIVANTDKAATQVTATLPKTVQDTLISNNVDAVKITTSTVTMTFSQTAIQQINTQAKADVTITAAKSDTSKLTGDAKALIGSRPMFDFNATYGNGKSITDFGGNTVSIAIPYTLCAGEAPGNLYGIYVDGNGKATKMTNSSYDANQKAVIFTTSHFSKYAVGYQATANFTDIANHWAKTDIEFVANRGLMSGTSNTTFSPNGAMTRGMFVTALGRLANVNPADYKAVVYTDVKADAYYAPYVSWAKANNITNDTTATTFSPDNIVTRQEMAVFMSNYAKAMGYKIPETREANTFADSAFIGTWAAAAVKQMQMAGVLNGKDNNKFDPTGTATRAEVAAVLHRYVSLVIDRVTTQGLDTNDSGSAIMYENGKMVKSASRTVGTSTYTFNTYGEAALLPTDKKTENYTVKKGDSFWLIAWKNNCTIAELEQLNGKSRNDIIYAGQVLKVPQE